MRPFSLSDAQSKVTSCIKDEVSHCISQLGLVADGNRLERSPEQVIIEAGKRIAKLRADQQVLDIARRLVYKYDPMTALAEDA